MPYGVASGMRPPSLKSAIEILGAAWELGIRAVDTAQAYGRSEEFIGLSMRQNPLLDFEVITKLHPEINVLSAPSVMDALRQSSSLLGKNPSALLIHNPEHLEQWDSGLGAVLKVCVEEGLVDRLGASIYSSSEMEQALALTDMHIVQVPFNALSRWLGHDVIKRAENTGVEIHVRSVFLQGLLLMTPDEIPPQLAFAKPTIGAWHAICRNFGLEPHAVAIKYVMQSLPSARIILGVDSTQHLQRNVEAAKADELPIELIDDLRSLSADEIVRNPSLWPV